MNAGIDNSNVDLWTVYNKATSLIEQLDKNREERTGEIVYERTFEKCTLLGQHAIKTTFKEYFKDSRYKEPKESYGEEYILPITDIDLLWLLRCPK